ncbi:MAG: hypothetical protein ABSC30_13775 [Acidimicrobiales bacterium]
MIPRRCPKCQRLIDASESVAQDPAMNHLWAVPGPHDNGAPAEDGARQGVLPAT